MFTCVRTSTFGIQEQDGAAIEVHVGDEHAKKLLATLTSQENGEPEGA